MTNYDCFSDWARGHIQDYYQNEEESLILGAQEGSIMKAVSKCAKEALNGLDSEEQEEIFGFTLEQIDRGELLKAFYINEILKEYP